MRKNLFLYMLIPLAIWLLCGCGRAEDEYSHTPCYVAIDNSVHQDPTLASAMNPLSTGVFCIIKKTIQGGADHYYFENNQGLTSTKLMNAIDKGVTFIPGANNGIIVGFGSYFVDPSKFFAYDLECPFCFQPNVYPIKTKPLSIDAKGWATCGACHRAFDMNNGGYEINGNGRLTNYPAATGGPFGRLLVQ